MAETNVSDKIYDLIIVGGGTAGLTAALYAVRGGLEVLLLEGEAPGGQIVPSPMVDNYPALSEVSGAEYAQRLLAQVKSAGGGHFAIKYQRVLELLPIGDIKTVRTAKAEYRTRTVIWAVGVKPRRLNVVGEEKLLGRGVSFCATCDGPLYRGREVAVIGGGNTALEEAIFLADISERVHLLHRREDFRAEQALQDRVAANAKIVSHMSTEVASIEGESGEIVLNLHSAEQDGKLTVAGVFLAVGKLPSNELMSPYVRLDEQGYLQVGEDCLTEVSGLFAAGDCRVKPLRQLVTAAADGAVAATQAINYKLHN